MEQIYRVSYIINGITERTDDFAAAGNPATANMADGWAVATMADGSTESAIQAIRHKFNGVWGFNPDAIEVKAVVTGHYEYRQPVTVAPVLPFFKGNKVFVAD